MNNKSIVQDSGSIPKDDHLVIKMLTLQQVCQLDTNYVLVTEKKTAIKKNIEWYHDKTDSLYSELENYWEGCFLVWIKLERWERLM
jgi:hypothetical protein